MKTTGSNTVFPNHDGCLNGGCQQHCGVVRIQEKGGRAIGCTPRGSRVSCVFMAPVDVENLPCCQGGGVVEHPNGRDNILFGQSEVKAVSIVPIEKFRRQQAAAKAIDAELKASATEVESGQQLATA